MNLCITSVVDILDPTYGGGARVLGLLGGLSQIAEINKIIVLYPFRKRLQDSVRARKIYIHNYWSHRSINSLRAIHYINSVDEVNPFRMSALTRIVKKFNVDIIQNETIFGSFASLMSGRQSSIPVIIDEHNFEAEYAQEIGRSVIMRFQARVLESTVVKSADGILSVSEQDRRRIVATYGVQRDKITIIPNGVNTERFRMTDTQRTRAKFELGLDTRFVLVFHGSLDYGPNRDAVASINDIVIPTIVKEIPEAFFMIIGRNPPHIRYDSRFLRFTGYVSDIAKHLAASDVAIVPLLRGGGTKMKLFEYLAAGLPIVATKKAVEGLPLKNAVHGLFSDQVDDAFMDNILTLYNDCSLRKVISQNERKIAEMYDWKTISEKLWRVYDKLLHN